MDVCDSMELNKKRRNWADEDLEKSNHEKLVDVDGKKNDEIMRIDPKYPNIDTSKRIHSNIEKIRALNLLQLHNSYTEIPS
ncbi:5468_t:CDS:2 [Gigaspora rosea]|nr:5468_t:CDS:2 [Gigaspora rosea]